MATTLCCIADLHIGGTTSVCKPVTNLDDGGTYHASQTQLHIWRSWVSYLDLVDKRKAGDVITIINGDIAEGDYKARSAQVITRNKANIVAMATDIIDPLAQLSQGVFVVRGTEAHAGQSAELEEEIAQDIGAITCPETNTASWWALPYVCEGVRLLCYHHPGGNGGGRTMNRYSGVDRLASDTVFNYANDNQGNPPDIVLCGHLHGYRDSYNHFRTRAIILPCWTFRNAYSYKLGIVSQPNKIGGVLIHCDAGEYEVEPILYRAKPAPYYSIGDVLHDDNG